MSFFSGPGVFSGGQASPFGSPPANGGFSSGFGSSPQGQPPGAQSNPFDPSQFQQAGADVGSTYGSTQQAPAQVPGASGVGQMPAAPSDPSQGAPAPTDPSQQSPIAQIIAAISQQAAPPQQMGTMPVPQPASPIQTAPTAAAPATQGSPMAGGNVSPINASLGQLINHVMNSSIPANTGTAQNLTGGQKPPGSATTAPAPWQTSPAPNPHQGPTGAPRGL